MRIKHITSATNIISSDDVNILVDPWLEDGEYYGSWYHYPKITPNYEELNKCDAIYISHIHPDHFSKLTLAKLNKNIPVIIHKYSFPFLKMNIEKLGFKAIELNHGEPFKIGDIILEIYAADNCDPAQCYKFFGCGLSEIKMGSTTIDTMAIFSSNNKTILNVNDCPYELSKNTLDVILKKHPNIDLLLTGYSGASSFPQCWDYDIEKRNELGIKKELYFLNQGKKFIDKVKPTTFMPFAGKYVLGGKNWKLDYIKFNPSLTYSLNWLNERSDVKGFILNETEVYEIGTLIPNTIENFNQLELDEYRNTYLSKQKYTYENEDIPSEDNLIVLLSDSFENLLRKIDELEFKTKTDVYIKFFDRWVKICISNRTMEIVNTVEYPYLTIELDMRLLHAILKGPRYAHWNNAEIGSHLRYSRNPDKYERGLHYCMNYFHSK